MSHITKSATPAVELDRITKRFGAQVAVESLSLQVPSGSIYGFIGPNGAGKTTTLRMMLNIYQPDSGSIRLFGTAPRGTRDPRIGYLPEERGLYRRMKVRESIEFFAELKTGQRQRPQTHEWLDRFELADWAERKVETLSKGMSQKLQFIAAVIGNPQLLVLDEPFSGLDPVNLDLLRRVILDLRVRGMTIIFSTHDMGVAERMCDFIFMIFRGRKVLDGTLSAIQEQYGTDTVRVRTSGAATLLRELPGVAQVENFGQMQELRLAPGADTQELLAALTQQTRLLFFEIARPSLHDIFVRIAGPGAREATHA